VQQAGGEPVGLGVLVARVGLGQILNLIKPTRIDLGVRMSSDLVEGVIPNREESQQDPKDGATGRAWPWRRDGGGRDFLGGAPVLMGLVGVISSVATRTALSESETG
jgi:hypothetical protein